MKIFFSLAVLLTPPWVFAQEADFGWPREIDDPMGNILIYQPQVDSFKQNDLNARTAVSVTPAGKSEPIFGAIWIEARVTTDRDTRSATFVETKVTQARFADASEDQEQALASLLTAKLDGQQLTLSLDRLVALLELAEHDGPSAESFDNTPPNIQFVNYPAILVTIEGAPQLRDIEGHPSVKQIVNSAFLIVLGASQSYLYAGQGQWYVSQKIDGPWQIAHSVPPEIQSLVSVEEESEARGETAANSSEASEEDLGPKAPPAILVTHEPMELIASDGDPVYDALGEDLRYMSNSESDVLVDIQTQRTFALLSGRWFAAPDLGGPWSYVAPSELPASFSTIPADSEMGHLRVWVPGTNEANEAVLDASIPQTASVPRTATIQVIYDGNPRFERIEGTSLYYATNTGEQVIRDGNKYYCAQNGVWYVSDQVYGPWQVATAVPDEIQKIPPSNFLFNTKYIHIYETTPDVVTVGYYPGYTDSFVNDGTVVYGTGWYYPSWGGTAYYPRATTYGFHPRWNPWYGWGMGFSYAAPGFTFGIGYGGRGGWHRGGYWGPVGYRPYHPGYSRGWNRPGGRGVPPRATTGALDNRHRAQNLYRHNNVARAPAPVARAGVQAPRRAPSYTNNMYADRAGNVHQRAPNGQWQQRSGRASTSGNAQQLNRAHQARQSGAARTQSHAAARGGGGRR